MMIRVIQVPHSAYSQRKILVTCRIPRKEVVLRNDIASCNIGGSNVATPRVRAEAFFEHVGGGKTC